MQDGFSKYAQRVADLRRDKKRSVPLWGLCVHTSGSGILRRARRKNLASPDELALDYYDSSKYSTHFVAGHKALYQITGVEEQVKHIGYTVGLGGSMTGNERRAWYHSGEWAEQLPIFAKRWREAWPGKASPSSLHPSKFPSMDYCAIECIPNGFGYGGVDEENGYRFSLAQHVAVALVALELAADGDWPDGWEFTGRLASHEDLGPHNRVGEWDNPFDGDAWDPGRHREKPWISWSCIQEWIRIGRTIGLESLAWIVGNLYARF